MKSRVEIIGVPMDIGQLHQGVDMGPSAIRYAGLSDSLNKLGYEVIDKGNIFVPVKENLHAHDNQTLLKVIKKTCEQVYKASSNSIKEKNMPI